MRTEWENGWWETSTAIPHPSLRSLVVGPYMGWTEESRVIVRRREAAGTIIPLIINFGAPYRVFSGADTESSGVTRTSFVAGLYDTWVAVEGARQSCALQVNFSPLAAFQLFGIPLSELANRSEECVALFGAEGQVLVEQLGNLGAWSARFAALDAFLRARLERAAPVSSTVRWCWDTLQRSGGRTSIAELLVQTGWSPKRLITEFRVHCGMTPRTVAGLHRFERAVTALEQETRPMHGRWSALALAHGYADQSHLVRDFTRFAGCAPTAYLRGRLASGGGVIDTSVR